VVGLKDTYTGNTLCSREAPLALEEIRFPKPVISQAIVPDKTTDETKLAHALDKLTRDDPTLKRHTDPETKQLILSGMGELHLEVSVEKLMRNPGVKVAVGKPMVAYRQTLSKPVDIETRYIKQTGGRGKFAVVNIKFEPLSKEQVAEWTEYQEEQGEKPDPNNLYFLDKIVGGVIPGSSSRRSSTATARRAPRGRSTASSAWTSRRRCTSASTTTWTARRTPSSWRPSSVRATPCSRPASRCWSRS